MLMMMKTCLEKSHGVVLNSLTCLEVEAGEISGCIVGKSHLFPDFGNLIPYMN